jgi:hypothetical protein
MTQPSTQFVRKQTQTTMNNHTDNRFTPQKNQSQVLITARQYEDKVRKIRSSTPPPPLPPPPNRSLLQSKMNNNYTNHTHGIPSPPTSLSSGSYGSEYGTNSRDMEQIRPQSHEKSTNNIITTKTVILKKPQVVAARIDHRSVTQQRPITHSGRSPPPVPPKTLDYIKSNQSI